MLRALNMLRLMLRNNVSSVVWRGQRQARKRKNPGKPGFMRFESAPARGRNLLKNPRVFFVKSTAMLRMMLHRFRFTEVFD